MNDQGKLAEQEWKKIAKDEAFTQRVECAKSSFLIPHWEGNLSDTFIVQNNLRDYSVLAVDGSQIYPDRHMSGAGCFLINIGGCLLKYGQKQAGGVDLFSQPKVFLIEDLFKKNDKIFFSSDIVDLKREDLELKKLLYVAEDQNTDVAFVDGSLIFWNLDSKQQEVKDLFLNSYLSTLNEFYEKKLPVAGYISFPKSKELVNLIKLGLCRFTVAECISCHSQYDTFPCKAVDNLIDTQVVRKFLKTYERTTMFWSKSKIVHEYPEHLNPCFFYLNVGSEIARIETLSWVAQSREHLDLICKVAIDQSAKGRGYPVCLAESHEQAVVKGADREFFYHLIHKVGIEQKRRFFMSQKSLKKRGIGI